ncbi:MAG: DUF2605 domain-containing protein [Leptolyngbya foveolarum]|uniref:DUF2605 domain-containing protein n=1 Tax=Leptolyngbya foveolarum TaxID=47253 RepID=A0A2W4UHF1_9CYAN|nr:MAG: DUF2605 domain-containing protein [Leptolyngbya foveolarum]
MTPSDPPSDLPEDKALLETILPPLLDDFQHWFDRTLTLLDTREISFLSAAEKEDLKVRVQTAQKQVSASKALTSLTDSQAGIEMPVVMAWHKLVHECWGVALRLRRESSSENESEPSSEP